MDITQTLMTRLGIFLTLLGAGTLLTHSELGLSLVPNLVLIAAGLALATVGFTRLIRAADQGS